MQLDFKSSGDVHPATGTPIVSRKPSDSNNSGGGKRQKLQPAVEGIAKFAKPRFKQFECRNSTTDYVSSFNGDIGTYINSMEYGIGISDLNLPESVVPIKRTSRFNVSFDKPSSLPQQIDMPNSRAAVMIDDQNDVTKQNKQETSEPPSKLVVKRVKLQLTCSFLFIPFDGKADMKAIKRVISEVNPQKVVVFRGPHEADYLR